MSLVTNTSPSMASAGPAGCLVVGPTADQNPIRKTLHNSKQIQKKYSNDK